VDDEDAPRPGDESSGHRDMAEDADPASKIPTFGATTGAAAQPEPAPTPAPLPDPVERQKPANDPPDASSHHTARQKPASEAPDQQATRAPDRASGSPGGSPGD